MVSNPIISLEEIMSVYDVRVSQENVARSKLQCLIDIDETDLKNRLIQWGASQFSDNYILYAIKLDIPDTCSDNVKRTDMVAYIDFLLPSFSIIDTLSALEERLSGMKLTYSYSTDFTLNVHISKNIA